MIKKYLASSIVLLAIFSGSLGANAQEVQRHVPQNPMEMQLSFAPLVKKAMPAVVNVYAARQVRRQATPFDGDPFFEQFFGGRFQNQPPRVQSSLGSGVIVDQSGLIVTNYHVIRGADDVKVALSDGREFESKVLLKDEATDIAVLKIDPHGLHFPVLALADSDKVEVGDLVLAIGNPFGVGQTVTSGIVSAQARTKVGISDFDFFIQTDAAINPGNSGGALIGMDGNLIGINTAIYSRTGGSIGIGFAIPSNLVRSVVETVKRGGSNFEQPYLGASFQGLDTALAESLGMEQPYGALVTDVQANSPAAKAGLSVGDIILTAQGQKIENPDALGYRLLTTGIDKTIDFDIMRNSKVAKITVVLTAMPSDASGAAEVITGNSPFTGTEVSNLTPINARRFNQPQNAKGVVISNVDDNSRAANVFAKGDVIRAVNGQLINTVNDLKKVLNAGQPQIWRLEFVRNGVLIRQFYR
ncbi:DegQ family serine endoprotease [Bartonella sp. HY329]|uniref:DegQ family serine endoprotease n=1 Tax=unclassified Bartonella TaxID=2645622 RepID=UPI0021C72477|nr:MULTISPECIES: DegQ family serine endoprotease [unclassified Bartonella]UXM93941.1 DegQ family serine endoprotease [Bartonella sp. HY329]UXN08262.1 DegQ family serine endoprotease [Bartonella sp. HY328]